MDRPTCSSSSDRQTSWLSCLKWKCPTCQLCVRFEKRSIFAFKLFLHRGYCTSGFTLMSNFHRQTHPNPAACANPEHSSASITRHPQIHTHTVDVHQPTTCMHSMLAVSFNSLMWLTFQGLTAGISCHSNHRSYDDCSVREHFSFSLSLSFALALSNTFWCSAVRLWMSWRIVQHPSTLQMPSYHRTSFSSCGSSPLKCDLTHKDAVDHTFE